MPGTGTTTTLKGSDLHRQIAQSHFRRRPCLSSSAQPYSFPHRIIWHQDLVRDVVPDEDHSYASLPLPQQLLPSRLA